MSKVIVCIQILHSDVAQTTCFINTYLKTVRVISCIARLPLNILTNGLKTSLFQNSTSFSFSLILLFYISHHQHALPHELIDCKATYETWIKIVFLFLLIVMIMKVKRGEIIVCIIGIIAIIDRTSTRRPNYMPGRWYLSITVHIYRTHSQTQSR